jgi:putative ABC transport system ATP-binding protein
VKDAIAASVPVSDPIIRITDLTKSYATESGAVPVIRRLNLTVNEGEMAAIVGPSGSGKTTLLSLIGGLDTADEGHIFVGERDVSRLGDHDLLAYRRDMIGFIFQFYNLLTTLTARENIELGLQFLPMTQKQRRARAEQYLELVGLAGKAGRFPSQMSGGEQQRVAVARALAKQPRLILADEPTGNLDRSSGRLVVELLTALQRQQRATCLIVTHDHELALRTDYIMHLRDGSVAKTHAKTEQTAAV